MLTDTVMLTETVMLSVTVMLSEAKHLFNPRPHAEEILRFAQNDAVQ